MKEYQVGQILFLIGDSNKVIPIQVVEEVIRTTLAGKEKTYIALLPDKKQSTFDIKKIKGQLFTDKHEVKSYMMKNANDAITSMINEASSIADSVFEAPIVSTDSFDNVEEIEIIEPDILPEKVQPEKENDIIKVDLGNGKFGKMSVGDLNKAGAPQ